MKGTQVAVFIIAFSLAVGSLVGLGFTDWVGVGGTVGLQDETSDFTQTDPSANGSGGILSFVQGALSIAANGLWSVAAESGSALHNIGVPWPIAYAIQAAVDVSMILLIASLFARMKLSR